MTSTTAPTGRPLPAWLKTTLLAAGVFALCWAGAIAYWRSAPTAPATPELLLALLAAPLALLGMLWIGKKAVSARPQAAATPAAAAQPAASATPSVPPLALLAAALRAPHGASPEELAAAIAGNKARPDLDPELVDDDGFPVMSARSADALDEALQEEISEWLVVNGLAELHLDDAQWRALILGTAVLRDLAGEAFLQLMPQEGTPPQLRLLPILPASWTVEQRHAAGLWFKHTVAQFGWPVDYLTRIDVAVGATPATLLGQCALDALASNKRVATILLACDSHIAQETVDTWMTEQILFTPARPQGLVPGEGAAGLMMTSLDHAQSLTDIAFTVLDPFKEARPASSADENRRSDTTLLKELAQQACKEANVELASVGMIAADTGQRVNRVQELMAVASSAFPHLDQTVDVACTGIGSGSCGAVPYVTALALAQHQASLRSTPVLYLGNEEAHVRYATLVRPFLPHA